MHYFQVNKFKSYVCHLDIDLRREMFRRTKLKVVTLPTKITTKTLRLVLQQFRNYKTANGFVLVLIPFKKSKKGIPIFHRIQQPIPKLRSYIYLALDPTTNSESIKIYFSYSSYPTTNSETMKRHLSCSLELEVSPS